MGLDMSAHRWHIKPPKEVDFTLEEISLETLEASVTKISYWHKHPNLHGWMEKLYREKGGTEEVFNGDFVVLNSQDLDRLEDDVLEGNLPFTKGFFFGTSTDRKLNDLIFIEEARKAIQEGDTVFYTGNW